MPILRKYDQAILAVSKGANFEIGTAKTKVYSKTTAKDVVVPTVINNTITLPKDWAKELAKNIPIDAWPDTDYAVKNYPIDALPISIPDSYTGIFDQILDGVTALPQAIADALSLPQTDAWAGTVADNFPDVLTRTNTIIKEKETVIKETEKPDVQVKDEPLVGSLEEAQTIADKLTNWAVSYVSPETGLFSKFPFSVPYDLYLVLAALSGSGGGSGNTLVDGIQSGVITPDGSTGANSEYLIKARYNMDLFGKSKELNFDMDLSGYKNIFKLIKLGVSILFTIGLLWWCLSPKFGKNGDSGE